MTATSDPLTRKRDKRAPIGWLVIGAVCVNCRTPDQNNRQILFEQLLEGDDGGQPYYCFRCGKELKSDGAG